MIAVTIAASAPRQIQTLVPSISSSIEWERELGGSEIGACDKARSPSAASTTAGTNGGASALASDRRRASRRQVNNCCGEIPCSRATSETTAPGASEASIARAFSSSDQRRRPPPPVITSIRRPAAALGSSSPSSLDTSRSPNQGLSLAHRRAKLKVGSKHRLRPVRILPEAKPDDDFGRFAKLKTALDESLGHRKPPPLVHNQAIMPPDNRPSPTPRHSPDGRRHPRKRVASKAGTPAEKASSQATRRG